ncbi:MAG TPA: cupin domain-containing protein [bacterium]|nr:cupin domain-containing protein [bacterium]
MAGQIEEVKVGEKIKQVREDKALRLEDVAKRTGLAPSVLSQIENHMVSPPLGTLIRLAKALEVPVGLFFAEEPEEPFCLVRAQERKVVSRFASTEGLNYGYAYESLGYAKKNRRMEPFVVTLNPPEVPQVDPNQHAGEEFIFVLEGEVEIILGDHNDVLRPGDSIYYDSNIPHVVKCYGDKQARIVAVIWPGEEMMIF